MVSHVVGNSGAATNHSQTISGTADNVITTQPEAPITQEPEISYLSCIRETLQVTGLSMDTIDIIVCSWREGTKSQYQSYAKKWFEFCKTNKCHIISPPLPLAMQFLSDMYRAGLSYGSINTARSVLSSLLYLENSSIPFGQLPIVKRFMKGIFRLRASLPKYSATWDVNLAFEYIRKHDLVLLKWKDLYYRIAFLLCLLSGQRCQTVSKLFLDNMVVNEDKVTFLITEKLKLKFDCNSMSHQPGVEELYACPTITDSYDP